MKTGGMLWRKYSWFATFVITGNIRSNGTAFHCNFWRKIHSISIFQLNSCVSIVLWMWFFRDECTWEGRRNLLGSRRLVFEFWDRFILSVKNGTLEQKCKPHSRPERGLLDCWELIHELNLNYIFGSREQYLKYEEYKPWAIRQTGSPTADGYESDGSNFNYIEVK